MPIEDPFVPVARFLDAAEAVTAQSALEGAGLTTRLLDAHMAGMNWLYGVALGGLRLEVPASQAAEAEGLLKYSVAVGLPPDEEAYSLSEHRARRHRARWAIALLLVPGLAVLGLLAGLLGAPPWDERRRVG